MRQFWKLPIYESRRRKIIYEKEYGNFLEGQDNDADDIRIKLALNCTFYFKKAEEKLNFLHAEAQDPFISRHNLGSDFRKGYKKLVSYKKLSLLMIVTFSSDLKKCDY